MQLAFCPNNLHFVVSRSWSQLGFITDSDVRAAVVVLLELNGDDEEIELDVRAHHECR